MILEWHGLRGGVGSCPGSVLALFSGARVSLVHAFSLLRAQQFLLLGS